MKQLPYETIICVDLRPFHPSKLDFGVGDYMDKLAFKPDILVFLNFFVDFVHRHEEVDETPFSRMTIGQRGTPAPHAWTKRDLAGLIACLKEAGVRSFLGLLSSTSSDIWKGVNIDWEFNEILQTKRGNQRVWGSAINPLKRFADGSYYEDVFARDLLKVLQDFEFDGYVAGDGMLGLRGPHETLLDTDFSEDMTEQFASFHGMKLPEFEHYDARADYIVENYFAEWVQFYVHRWGLHVEKLTGLLKPNGKSLMAIDAWSRNPEELITAFGIDYRVLHQKGLEAVFVQARETNKWRKHREGEYVREENSVYGFLTHKAYEPGIRYYWAEATINLPEFWNSVLDLPHVLERETYGYLWSMNWRNGEFSKAIDGICVIWGNDLTEEQWRWLVQRWSMAYSQIAEFQAPAGLTLLWSELGIKELNAENKRYGQRFAKLLNLGLCIQSSVHADELHGEGEQGWGSAYPEQHLLTFDQTLLQRLPSLAHRVFLILEDYIQFKGVRYSWQEGIELMKHTSGIRTSRGRVLGFQNRAGALVLSLENQENLFYEQVKLTVPFHIDDVKVLPPREWFAIPESTEGNATQISVAPDASTQVIVHRSKPI